MELGKYLKSCREALKRTQPDVAGEVEIEQSYLSKLESGKSIPSDDVFNKLVKVYNIDIAHLVSVLPERELENLRGISAVYELFSKTKKRRLDTAKKFSIAGLISATIGAGLLAFSILPDRSESQYIYRSEGVLQPGEELKAFYLVYEDSSTMGDDEELLAKQRDLTERLKQKDVKTLEFKGTSYVEETADGKRYFELLTKIQGTRNYWNRWFFVPAFMLLVGGIGCFFVSRRWDKS